MKRHHRLSLLGILLATSACSSNQPVSQCAPQIGVRAAVLQPTPPPMHVVATGITPAIAQYANTIYLAYADTNRIWLTSTADGVSWAAPQQLSSSSVSAYDPAILFFNDGTRVVTWKEGTSLRYTYNNGCTGVSGTALYGWVHSYDIKRLGGDVHLVIADGYSTVMYATFPATSPLQQLYPGGEIVIIYPLCASGNFVSHPGIAVHQPPAGPPEVVVAFYLYDASATPPDVGSRIVRRLGPFNWQGVSGFVTPIFNFSLVTNTFPYSLSLTVSTDGTYLLAASDVVNSVSRVTFVRGAAVSWKKLATTYPVNIAHAVSVYGTDSSQFNIASTAFPQTPPSYGLGARRAVGWPLSAQTPFWQGPQPLEAESKNPRATNIRICNGNSLCVINAVFARRNGNSSEIVTDVTCTQSPLCPNGVKLCIPDATAEMTRVHVPNATNGLHRAPAGTSIVSSGPRPCVVARTKSASR